MDAAVCYCLFPDYFHKKLPALEAVSPSPTPVIVEATPPPESWTLHGETAEEILALEPEELGVTIQVIQLCEKSGTKVSVIPFYNDVIPTRANIDNIGSIKLIQLRTTPLDEPFNAGLKRAFDIAASALALIVLIVLVNDAERRIPVQYSKRVVGRKMYGGQSTFLPMKVNMSGVLPIIFAQSIASLPATICMFKSSWQESWLMKNVFDTNTWVYAVIYFLLIIFFSYFYSTIQFNPIEVANNLKKNGGYIPGFRPGKPTSEFIQKVLNKITLFGAIYLGIIAVVPILIAHFSNAAALTGISLGGTSIIIVVGVALETIRALEAQMLMRNYKGFLD